MGEGLYKNPFQLFKMIISHKHKFIFIKTFKTAGSSIEKYLYNYLDTNDILTGSKIDGIPSINAKSVRHRSASWIKEKYPTEWKEYYKFAVDRNPWDVAVSWFFWMKHAEQITYDSFDDFIKEANLSVFKNWNKYTIDNNIVVDKVLKYENLIEEIKTIPVPYNNELTYTFVKSGYRGDKDYRKYYTKETLILIEKNFTEVINLFGYEF